MNQIGKMIEAIEYYLIRLIEKKCTIIEPIDKVSQLIVNQDKNASLAWLASQSCLSVRQFIRRFEEHMGISVKMFQKLVRFDRAYHQKNNQPDKDWLYIALSCGYYDYQHLAKDFRTFVNLSPSAFYEIEKMSPERVFALHES
jgi:transcriptional regulator GlxA family with amidase domain